MLRLENVKKDDNLITANFFFVGEDEKGSVEYDIGKNKITKALYGDKDPLTDFVYGFGYIKQIFEMMVQNNKYPSDLTYEWY